MRSGHALGLEKRIMKLRENFETFGSRITDKVLRKRACARRFLFFVRDRESRVESIRVEAYRHGSNPTGQDRSEAGMDDRKRGRFLVLACLLIPNLIPVLGINMAGAQYSEIQERRRPRIYGGKPGVSAGRYQPSLVTPPGMNFGASGLIGPPPLPEDNVSLILPTLPGEAGPSEGPPGGLTLEEAANLMVRRNLDLQALHTEIAQADSDIVTAGLRANPVVFIDAQQVPYGSFSPKRTGIPIQYDANIVHPFDLSGKRRARKATASLAKRVVAARYLDAVRRQMDNLHRSFVDALAAQENARIAASKNFGRDIVVRVPEENPKLVLSDAQRTLAVLLNLPVAELARRGLRGRLEFRRSDEPVAPPPAELVRSALIHRPDLAALRFNVVRADSDIVLAKANRFEDVLALYQPYTFHDGRTGDFKNSVAWAAGLTVPIPLYNREQGNIQKARQIAVQARIQLASYEKTVSADVLDAIEEHEAAHALVDHAAAEVAEMKGTDKIKLDDRYRNDETVRRMLSALEKLQDESYVEKLRRHGDAIVRHRKSMLRLNTVVGAPVMP